MCKQYQTDNEILIVEEARRDLELLEPDEAAIILGLTTEQILTAFPGHVYDYAVTSQLMFDENGEVVDYENPEETT